MAGGGLEDRGKGQKKIKKNWVTTSFFTCPVVHIRLAPAKICWDFEKRRNCFEKKKIIKIKV